MDQSVGAAENQGQEIKPKQHFSGTVAKTTLAGALIDIGANVPAVLLVSQMKTPEGSQPLKKEEYPQPGQQVEVWVRKVKDNRIELTMYKPLDLEWRDLKKGMNVKGKVTKLEKYGAFVEIGAERPGLIHISELAHGYVRTPAEVVNEGDEIEAQVLDVNRRKKQIKLSLKALQPEPVKEETAKPAESAPRERPERGERRRRGRRGEKGEARGTMEDLAAVNAAAQNEPTAMEVALREAMERAKTRRGEQPGKARKSRNVSKDQEEIFARTLEHKSRTA